MIIVAGWLRVEPASRGDYLLECAHDVASARAAKGCREFSVSADIVDDWRVTVYERWDTEGDLLAFRDADPGKQQQVAVVEASVRRYEISSEGPA